MRILITGSKGYIGAELVKHLAERHDVTAYDVADGKDILDKKALAKAMKGCDLVIHLAAIPKPEDRPFDEYFRINCEGTFNVAEACVAAKVRKLIFTSSTTYYGVEKNIPFPKPIKEDNLLITQFVKEFKAQPRHLAYSTSKVIAEQILANYGMTKKLKVTILRLGAVRDYGVTKLHEGTNLKMENALHAFDLAIAKDFDYEAFTITDDVDVVDLEKAKKLLGYKPS